MMPSLLHKRLGAKLQQRASHYHWRQLPQPLQAGVDFASNDYLGLSRCPALQQAVFQRLQAWPQLGSTGSRLLTGNSHVAMELEHELAKLFKAPTALLFNSGYTLNLGLLQVLCEHDDVVVMDELVHASWKDGLKLAKGRGYYFRHNDCQHLRRRLERLLGAQATGRQAFVVVESVYSMDGDMAPLADLVRLCEDFGAALIVDEAHGLGTIGAQGEGLVSHLGFEERVLARIHTFGKAWGAHGAALLGSQLLKDSMINFCHSFLYTTALPPHSLLVLQAVLEHWQTPAWQARFARLQAHISLMNDLFALGQHPAAIYSFPFAELADLKNTVLRLREEGMVVLPIYAPTVQRGSERLRVCLHSFNQAEEIRRLSEVLLAHGDQWQKPVCNRY